MAKRPKYKYKGPRRMAACSKSQVEGIMSVVHSFRGKNRDQAEEFANAMAPKNLCVVLHSMRRWYSGWSWNNAKKIIASRAILKSVMDLDVNYGYGIYRGFKLPNDAEISVGDRMKLPVTRNGGCSSWTTKVDLTNRFSGAGKGKIGVIVRLVGGKNVKPFIAPPQYSVGWFNDLYKKTMGESFRFNEHEFAIWSPSVEVEVVKVKR